jgi:hypothetical protein
LDWAKVRGYRVGENPARWRGHLDKLLPARKGRCAALSITLHCLTTRCPNSRPRFAQRGSAACVLEFAILTAVRTGEVIGAGRDEIDFATKLYRQPGPLELVAVG